MGKAPHLSVEKNSMLGASLFAMDVQEAVI